MHRTKVRIVEDALDANNTIARANRDDFDRSSVSVVNLMSAPGAGKTAILRQLELEGFDVVEEAATDVIALWQAQGIAEPWTDRSFIDAVASLLSTHADLAEEIHLSSGDVLGKKLQRQLARARTLGYRTCLSYDIDSLDWTDPSTATVRHAVTTATAGSIVSMHLGHQVTINALPGILDDLAARGLTPVTASRLLQA